MMKLSSKMLQNLSYFWNKKTHSIFVFHFEQLWIFNSVYVDIDRASTVKNPKLLEMKMNKKIFEFSYLKNMANFEAFLLDNFIKHKHLISEECIYT